MSEGCGNPNCPTHGKRAKELNDAKTKIAINTDLMGVIRILAANVDTVFTVQQPENRRGYLQRQIELVRGNYDSHPAVQGIMDGFSVLLCGHRPTQEFFNTTRQVPEGEGFVDLAIKDAEGLQQDMAGAVPMTIADLLAALKGMR
jgi:hypothetical protein